MTVNNLQDDQYTPLEREKIKTRFNARVEDYAATYAGLRDGWGRDWKKHHTFEEAEHKFLLYRYIQYCKFSCIRYTPDDVDQESFESVSRMVRDCEDIWD